MDTSTAIVLSVLTASAAGVAGYLIRAARQTITEPVGKGIEATERVIKPISDGIGKICEAAAKRLSEKTEELNRLRVENQNLSGTLERIRNQKVNVNSVELIFKWALATFELQYTDFQMKTLREEAPSIGRNEKEEYVGVIRKDYKQTLGVDVKKLSFKLEGNNILVKGLFDVEVIGFKDVKTDRLFTEKRIFKWGSSMLPNSTEIVGG